MGFLSDPILVVFVGYVCGSAGRTAWDYLWKVAGDPDLIFDVKYIISMLVALILSFISSMVTFANVQFPPGTMWFIFFWGVQQGYVMNDIVNKPLTYALKLAEKLKSTPELTANPP